MVEIKNLTSRKLPSSKLRFKKIAETVLGKKYELSLVFVGSARARSLNKKFRGKNKAANVLSFPLDDRAGEIFINLDTKKGAADFEMSHPKFVEFLLIHGALHLKGFEHGKKMEAAEKKFLKLTTDKV